MFVCGEHYSTNCVTDMLNNGWSLSIDGAELTRRSDGVMVPSGFLSSPGVYNKVFVQARAKQGSFVVTETNTSLAFHFLTAMRAERFLLAISDSYRLNLAIDSAAQDPEFASVAITKSCSCNVFDLMNHGCKCGAMDIERKTGVDK